MNTYSAQGVWIDEVAEWNPPPWFGEVIVLHPEKLYFGTVIDPINDDSGRIRDALHALFPELANGGLCPVCTYRALGWQIITHLNDAHKWPREKIADWLDGEWDA